MFKRTKRRKQRNKRSQRMPKLANTSLCEKLIKRQAKKQTKQK